MTSLVDRYVFTVLRRVPDRQRTDIDRELRASIEDAVDARVDAGETREAAVERTLTELGDPERLAAGYADRPQYLIGPELLPAWRRLVLMLLSVVLPIVVTVVVVAQLLDEPTAGSVIGTAVSAAINLTVHLVFWTTAVFAVLERTEARSGMRRDWSLDDLPTYEPNFLTPSQLAANLVWPVLLIVALVLQQFTFSDEPVLDPANWSFWWPYLIVVLLLECGYAVWLYRRGGWSHTVTVVNAVLQVLFAAPVIWLLATERFFNPAFVASLDTPGDPLRWLTGIVLIVVLVAAVWDVVEVAVRAERARRGVPAPVPGSGDHTVGVR